MKNKKTQSEKIENLYGSTFHLLKENQKLKEEMKKIKKELKIQKKEQRELIDFVTDAVIKDLNLKEK